MGMFHYEAKREDERIFFEDFLITTLKKYWAWNTDTKPKSQKWLKNYDTIRYKNCMDVLCRGNYQLNRYKGTNT